MPRLLLEPTGTCEGSPWSVYGEVQDRRTVICGGGSAGAEAPWHPSCEPLKGRWQWLVFGLSPSCRSYRCGASRACASASRSQRSAEPLGHIFLPFRPPLCSWR
jgi:hypothetical protein